VDDRVGLNMAVLLLMLSFFRVLTYLSLKYLLFRKRSV
jgi:hypothetical protein